MDDMKPLLLLLRLENWFSIFILSSACVWWSVRAYGNLCYCQNSLTVLCQFVSQYHRDLSQEASLAGNQILRTSGKELRRARFSEYRLKSPQLATQSMSERHNYIEESKINNHEADTRPESNENDRRLHGILNRPMLTHLETQICVNTTSPETVLRLTQ